MESRTNLPNGGWMTEFFGTRVWLNQKEEIHREDGPAIEFPNGTKEWYRNGKYHREDGPAVEYSNGTKEWYQNGKLHRLDGPARDHTNGLKMWYFFGKLFVRRKR